MASELQSIIEYPTEASHSLFGNIVANRDSMLFREVQALVCVTVKTKAPVFCRRSAAFINCDKLYTKTWLMIKTFLRVKFKNLNSFVLIRFHDAKFILFTASPLLPLVNVFLEIETDAVVWCTACPFKDMTAFLFSKKFSFVLLEMEPRQYGLTFPWSRLAEKPFRHHIIKSSRRLKKKDFSVLTIDATSFGK